MGAGDVATDGLRQTLFSDRKFHPSLSRPIAQRTAESMNRIVASSLRSNMVIAIVLSSPIADRE
jgi:hypothetical protein